MTPEETARFREWQIGRGYAEATATSRATVVRRLHDVGVTDPEDVDGAYPNFRRETRCVYRGALRAYDDFLKAVA